MILFCFVLLIVGTAFVVNVDAQSRRNFEGFSIDLNRNNRAIAIRFDEEDSAGCSSAYSANASLLEVAWDIIPTKFVANFKSHKKSFFVPDSVGNISNAERGLLADIFANKKRLRITWRECGSGSIGNLVALKVLP